MACNMRIMRSMKQVDRRKILELAGAAEVDPRTARKALDEGVGSIRGEAVRERINRCAKDLGIKVRE